MKTRVLITGANGLLATNVIIELLARNYLVRGLLRNPQKFCGHRHPNLELLQGDITDNEFLEKAVRDCDHLIHTAAITDQNLVSYNDYHQVNVSAVNELIKISIREKVKRFVYISSANVFGHGSKKNPGNEQTPPRKPFTASHYAMSKLRGQQIVLNHQDEIDVVVTCPSLMLGPYDSGPSSGRIILIGYNKKIILCPPGGKNIVHVKDAAIGVVNALEKGKSGEIYLLANENLSYKEFFQKLSAATERNPVLVKIPRVAVLSLGFFGDVFRRLGIKTSLSLVNMKILCTKGFYSSSKAEKELGIKFRKTEEAIEDAVKWFKENNLI